MRRFLTIVAVGAVAAAAAACNEGARDAADVGAAGAGGPDLRDEIDDRSPDQAEVVDTGDSGFDAPDDLVDTRDGGVPDLVEPVDAPTNLCGGRQVLAGTPGDACGLCANGVWVCQGADSVVCDGATENACGGCAALDHQPGDVCGGCHLDVFVCAGADAVVCSGDTRVNSCGGCDDWDFIIGQPCGPCDLDTVVCIPESTAPVCSGETTANACGGCFVDHWLDSDIGTPCGPCFADTWVCNTPDSLACSGETTDVCGSCYIGRAEGDVCGPCDAGISMCVDDQFWCDFDTRDCAAVQVVGTVDNSYNYGRTAVRFEDGSVFTMGNTWGSGTFGVYDYFEKRDDLREPIVDLGACRGVCALGESGRAYCTTWGALGAWDLVPSQHWSAPPCAVAAGDKSGGGLICAFDGRGGVECVSQPTVAWGTTPLPPYGELYRPALTGPGVMARSNGVYNMWGGTLSPLSMLLPGVGGDTQSRSASWPAPPPPVSVADSGGRMTWLDADGRVWVAYPARPSWIGIPSDATLGGSATPQEVVGLDSVNVVEVIAFGVVLDDQGQLWSWGPGTPGRPKTGVESYAVGRVDLPLPVVQAANNGLAVCAVLEDGSVWCFGDLDERTIPSTRDTEMFYQRTPLRISFGAPD